MNLQTRLAKLESASGIFEPCAVCEVSEEFMERLRAMRKMRGLPLHAAPQDTRPATCVWCARPIVSDFSHVKGSERASVERLFDRSRAAYTEGRLCDPKEREGYTQLIAIGERTGLALYGEAYREYIRDFNAALDAATARMGQPRMLYKCQIEGCDCLTRSEPLTLAGIQ